MVDRIQHVLHDVLGLYAHGIRDLRPGGEHVTYGHTAVEVLEDDRTVLILGYDGRGLLTVCIDAFLDCEFGTREVSPQGHIGMMGFWL